MATALTIVKLDVQGLSLSPVVDNAGFGLVYQALGGVPVLADVTGLCGSVATALTSFVGPAVASITAYWDRCISRAANSATIHAYDISNALALGQRAGSPVTSTAFAPSSNTATNPMPQGVCCVVTLQAPYGTDVEFGPGTRPRSRDRGRVYFGPLTSSGIEAEATTYRAVITPTCAQDLTQGFKQLALIAGAAGLSWQLSVWSRKNAAVKPVQQVWVDDRPDYQRRRADQGTTRYTLTVP